MLTISTKLSNFCVFFYPGNSFSFFSPKLIVFFDGHLIFFFILRVVYIGMICPTV